MSIGHHNGILLEIWPTRRSWGPLSFGIRIPSYGPGGTKGDERCGRVELRLFHQRRGYWWWLWVVHVWTLGLTCPGLKLQLYFAISSASSHQICKKAWLSELFYSANWHVLANNNVTLMWSWYSVKNAIILFDYGTARQSPRPPRSRGAYRISIG